ncbi:MAG TPA: YggS family pyridoxal phosphate-dependent enzyme [Aggregatilineaceae bacterium]|nr:YggS family pyridoxal phosphate-dependent enzyme [Aggregatilineaceae bacterium]
METAAVTIGERVAAVQAEIAAACRRAGRSPDSVTLVAVSKTHPARLVAEVVEAGVRHFGENRVEEALGKMPEVARLIDEPIHWHMVGAVQTRKARYLVTGFSMLHSLGSVKLAERLSRYLVEQDRTLDVLLEMNVSGEATKQGWEASRWRDDLALRRALWSDISQVLALPGLSVRGLMTMAPLVDDPEKARPVFATLRDLRDAIANGFPGSRWHDLSMGMTDDFRIAVEEGATLVRVGRAIFGPRS